MHYFAKLQGQKVHEYLAFPLLCTGLGKRVVPRLRESRFPTPSGRGVRVHATWGPLFCSALYLFFTLSDTKAKYNNFRGQSFFTISPTPDFFHVKILHIFGVKH